MATVNDAQRVAKKMLAEGSIYTFAGYKDARKLAQIVMKLEKEK